MQRAKGRLFLFHWKAAEAKDMAGPLRSQGWTVDVEVEDGARGGRLVRDDPPDAVVIYLTRLPSHGRETAHFLRSTKAARDVPIIFVGGQGDALEKTRAKVPDAIYATAQGLGAVLAELFGTGRKA